MVRPASSTLVGSEMAADRASLEEKDLLELPSKEVCPVPKRAFASANRLSLPDATWGAQKGVSSIGGILLEPIVDPRQKAARPAPPSPRNAHPVIT